jgi:hypothetical protein
LTAIFSTSIAAFYKSDLRLIPFQNYKPPLLFEDIPVLVQSFRI